ncbi:MAG: DUF4404 family protein [Pseudomonadales bacterium]|jgi:hypothetical protein|nr:DUF4404 family protein [Pseudomonadales bacterium]
MPQQSLRAALDTLRDALADPGSLGDDNRRQLEQLAKDLDRVLDAQDSDESLRTRIEDAALEFEAEHPRLSATLGEVVQALAKMGI